MAKSLTRWVKDFFIEHPKASVRGAMAEARDVFPGRVLKSSTFQAMKSQAKEIERLNMKAIEVLVNGVVNDRLTGSRQRAEELVHELFNTHKDAHTQDVMTLVADKVQELLLSHRPIEIVEKKKVGKKTRVRRKKLKFTAPEEFELMLAYATIRKNILLVGPTGSGKSFLAERLAEALKLPFYSASCSIGMSESQLAGWLLPIKANGRFGYVPAPFVTAYTKGGVFLLDELDNGDANVLTFMNAALSNGHMFIPQRGVDGESMVLRHPDFICIAAANTFGTGPDAQYVGRNKLDAATLNRFASQRIYLDYSEAVEMSVSSKRVYVWAKAIRKEIRSRRLRRIMSTRNMIDFTDQDKSGNKLLRKIETWEASFFADWKEDERRAIQQAGRQALSDELGEEVTA